MIEKIWKVAQIQNLLNLRGKYKIPQEVIGAIERLIEILDTEYGLDRDVDSDSCMVIILCDWICMGVVLGNCSNCGNCISGEKIWMR